MRAENLTGTVLTLACGFGLGATGTQVAKGDKDGHKDKQMPQAEHLEESYEGHGLSEG